MQAIQVYVDRAVSETAQRADMKSLERSKIVSNGMPYSIQYFFTSSKQIVCIF